MLESTSLQKNRLRSAKNVIFSIFCILVDRPMGNGGGLNPQPPSLRTPLFYVVSNRLENNINNNNCRLYLSWDNTNTVYDFYAPAFRRQRCKNLFPKIFISEKDFSKKKFVCFFKIKFFIKEIIFFGKKIFVSNKTFFQKNYFLQFFM